MYAVAARRLTQALAVLGRFGARERPSGIEQVMVEPVLALHSLRVEAAGLKLCRQIARLLCEWARSLAAARRSQPLELIREGALLRRRGPATGRPSPVRSPSASGRIPWV